MAKPTFLFDLDQTLLDTSELEADRRRRRWDKVKAKLDQVKPFRKRGLFPHELPDKLKTNGHPVAIVTSSPRWYAQPLLKQFQIPYDLLVAYDDTSQHKPDPAPLLLALEKLGCPPEQAYYVGDATTDVQASFRAGVKSIGAGWQSKDWPLVGMDQLADAPDIMLYEPTLLLKEPLLQSSQYFAELVTSGIEPNRHFGSMLVWKSQATEFIALGRYFKTADIRHGSHRYTRKIIELKRSDAVATLFARALAPIITAIGLRPS
jgi:HAD superfamily hydrolase (TIGR01549 family)